MLVYTAEYLVNSYNNGHGDIVIDGLFVTIGYKESEHPQLDEAKEIFKKAGIPVYINPRNDHQIIHTEEYQNRTFDMFQPWHLVVKKLCLGELH